MSRNLIFKNVLNVFSNQLLLMIMAIIVPRLFILNYGSEVNGLFLFVGQVFSYFAIFEGGIGIATVQALYKPISTNNSGSISSILVESLNQYKKLTFKYILAVFLFAGLFTLYSDLRLDKSTIFLVIFLQGVAGAMNFYFVASFRQLFFATGKNYVVSNITTIFSFSLYVVKIVLITLKFDVVFIQIAFLLLSVIQVYAVYFFFRKYFPFVDLNATGDLTLFSENKAILVHQISGLVFSNTNLIVLSIFGDLNLVSIYATYNLLVYSVYNLIGLINSNLQFYLGQKFHDNFEEFKKIFSRFNLFLIMFAYIVVTILYFVLNPFINLYTEGADVNYLYEFLPLLFCVVQLLDVNRLVSSGLIVIAGHMRKTMINTITEALINVVFSVFFVFYFGVYGVLMGTIVALLYRSNDILIYTCTKILKVKYWMVFKPVLVNMGIFWLFVWIKNCWYINSVSYVDLLIDTIIFSSTIFAFYFVVNFVFFRKYLRDLLKFQSLFHKL
jgi:hypothetical protein